MTSLDLTHRYCRFPSGPAFAHGDKVILQAPGDHAPDALDHLVKFLEIDIDLCGHPHKSMSMMSGSEAVADEAGFRLPAAFQARVRSSRVRVSNP